MTALMLVSLSVCAQNKVTIKGHVKFIEEGFKVTVFQRSGTSRNVLAETAVKPDHTYSVEVPVNLPGEAVVDCGRWQSVNVWLEDENLDLSKFFNLKDTFLGLSNSPEDYSSIYHMIDGKPVCHDRVHNIYGANMTRAAGEHFAKKFGDGKILMFSRASYIGAHRSSGIWFGDNHSWWSHILLNLKMLPSANMCGFLYCGADLGGFNENATRDLVLRFLALGVFTPLMRNHSALGTKDQECYNFENPEDFRDIVTVRYRLIPYLYDTFRRASENNDMIFRPLAFDYPEDKMARECETQLMLGDECMICPVYEQNVSGRYVYLPEDMTFVKLSGENVTSQPMEKGVHFIEVALNEVPLFIRKGRQIPLCKPAMRTGELDLDNLTYIG